jgi:Rps23 Pro-64 3,4-dihydroxylase Tpa1-like proline 4-hydroxylase
MNFIYENNNSISPELCEEIISLFEKSQNKYDGLTLGGVNKNIKDTKDYIIDKSHSSWSEIYSFLETELAYNISKYFEFIKETNKNLHNIGNHELISKNIEVSNFMVQRYIQNQGKYTYHNDFHIDFEKKSYRVLTYLFYLNHVDEGGETEFYGGDIKIKPKQGKMILFPSSWTYPHSGKMPVSSNKYIITGWIYNKY